MGVSIIPIPSPTAFAWGLGIGIVIPLVSSIIPLNVVLTKNLNDALDYTHSKTKAVYVKILKANHFNKVPYIVFGSLSVFYGLAIYYFLPLALL